MAKPSYESLVSQGRKAAKAQWTLGDLAARVEVAYGDGKLQEYAEDIGVDYRTLLDYRTVARAYEKSERSELPWSVHRVLAAQDDRVELVQNELTYRAAQALVRGRKETSATPGVPPIEEDTWLGRAFRELKPIVEKRTGLAVPDQARVSVGWPSSGKHIGQHWSGAEDGVSQIYVSPQIGDADRVLDILVHEMLHSALPKEKHGKKFKEAVDQVGLEGPATATHAGPALKLVLADVADRLGDYPHSPISIKQTTKTAPKETEPNTIKYVCVDCQSMNGDGEGYYCTVTVPRHLLREGHGWPELYCPIDGKKMEVLEDE